VRKRVTVIEESDSGRNLRFHDNRTGSDMTRAQFVKQIQDGNYEKYHVRKLNGVPTPVSNPNSSENDNLG